jgi:hypothetical protein
MSTLLRDRSSVRSQLPDPPAGRGVFARLGRVLVTHPGKVFARSAALCAQPTRSTLPTSREGIEERHVRGVHEGGAEH